MCLSQIICGLLGILLFAFVAFNEIYNCLAYPPSDVPFSDFFDFISAIFAFGCYIWLLVKFVEAF